MRVRGDCGARPVEAKAACVVGTERAGGGMDGGTMMLRSILDVPMTCELCGTVTRAGDCEPDVDGDGSLGCPLPDCGGIVHETLGDGIGAEVGHE